MAAWLLYMKQHPSPLWRSYLALLPAEHEMACLLNYSRDEILELQVPSLQVWHLASLSRSLHASNTSNSCHREEEPATDDLQQTPFKFSCSGDALVS